MSSLFYYLTIYYLLPSFVTSLALNTPQNSKGSISLTKPVNNSTIKDVLLLNPNTTTILTTARIDCDERRFGNPPAASCKNAIAQIPQDPATITRNPNRRYGPRGWGTWDVTLPKRYISSDGQCIIDLGQTSAPSHVRNSDLLGAGTIIQRECVEKDTPPWGGQVFDMADEMNFLFTMRVYSPPFIRCSNTPPAARPESPSCQTILNTMKVTIAPTKFGAVGIADVDEHLPQTLTEPTGKCSITIDTTAPDSQASWYDLWQAAVALDGMCVRAGRPGKARFLGMNRKLVVEMKKS